MSNSGPHALVAVGVGNTSLHIGVFDRDCGAEPLPQPTRTFRMSSRTPDWPRLSQWQPPTDLPWYVASVYREGDQQLVDWLQAELPPSERLLVRRLTPADFAVEMLFDHQALGVDRAAAVLAANQLRLPQRPAIVIDAGTAITVEGVDAEGRFVGGAILPGITLSARALEMATDLLPFVALADADSAPPALGKSTEQAIRGGLYWGAVGAVQQLIAQAALELSPKSPSVAAQVFLTGGNGKWLQSRLKGPSVFDPHLVLSGIGLAAANLPSLGTAQK